MKCRYCEKELATQADYDEIPEGEGEHLCWSSFAQPCIDADEALDIARARIAELEAIVADAELSGAWDDAQRSTTEIRRAVNAACACGGGEPSDCCLACKVWHILYPSNAETRRP